MRKSNILNQTIVVYFILNLIILVQPNLAIGQSQYSQKGVASYYADKFEGRLTASGQKYKHSKLTAAHKTLPFGTLVKVTNLKNEKYVVVEINDRGPYVEGRIIDVSKSAAETLGFINDGLADVEITVVDPGDGKNNDYPSSVSIEAYSEVSPKEFYSFNVDRINSAKGYGVQIGSFEEMANLVRLAQNLKASYKKDVTVQVSQLNDKKIYKIIVGREKNREKAEKLKTRLKRRYPDCFIFNFSLQ